MTVAILVTQGDFIDGMQDYFLQFFGNNSPLITQLIKNIHLLRVFIL
ncbi:isochorismatase [Photorhabdus temperata subsp. temperata M1021]|uniref:Uncharacterized protein n=1 Tax=Photorhabdus temperata J3 TaxID=1389415 RepID=U7QXZ3_PHOTE|nr:isochorismatase [Photorhabdus temperata subsp. temperata M1021]ERT11907.1 hypothetical protein O185_16875 [Photorhabdus temperata J3]